MKPRKRFGQNFLKDPGVIARIVDAIRPSKDDRIVEIGPGLGALTAPLLRVLDRLDVIEIDRDIVETLSRRFSPEKLVIHQADALKFDFSSLGSDLRIVGNLPYNISTPLLFHLSEFSRCIMDMHFMLQKEVVDRMTANPSSADYGRLSVMLQHRFAMEKCFEVPPECFYPEPKVDSAIVRMVPLASLLAKDEAFFSKVVLAAFSQRRKTLRNTLKHFLSPEDFISLEIDQNDRAENLSVSDFAKISNRLAEKEGR
ncbi:MAG TPA: 16S rRNA (adenine(1518)-N(6)/adenine(1519)-N(6))-dimethyltransferase RsmA [Burkholderiales bacterium]|nr:16S rRNA (adenine(1518)-N(6)/adenine(1519)-N(6))-dimethyltransferase RsmA [Burkholderiales bacterium]